jgi:hypothetical protein
MCSRELFAAFHDRIENSELLYKIGRTAGNSGDKQSQLNSVIQKARWWCKPFL